MSENSTFYEEIKKRNDKIKELNKEIRELIRLEEEKYIKHLASENAENTTLQNNKD